MLETRLQWLEATPSVAHAMSAFKSSEMLQEIRISPACSMTGIRLPTVWGRPNGYLMEDAMQIWTKVGD
jgi:hypothetical protein